MTGIAGTTGQKTVPTIAQNTIRYLGTSIKHWAVNKVHCIQQNTR